MAEVAERDLERWPRGRPFALHPRVQAITLEVVLRAVFGVREEERLGELREAIHRFARTSNAVVWLPPLRRDLGPLTPWRRFVAARKRVDELVTTRSRTAAPSRSRATVRTCSRCCSAPGTRTARR